MLTHQDSHEQAYRQFIDGEITEFYDMVYPLLVVFARRLLTEPLAYLAEDCVQDAVFQLYAHREEMSCVTKAKAFLYTCIHNTVISYIRKDNSRSQYVVQNADDFEHDFSMELIRQETLDQLLAAVSALPEDMQQLCHSIFVKGMKNVEIARELNISESGVKKKKKRLLNMLRASLSAEAYLLVAWVVMR